VVVGRTYQGLSALAGDLHTRVQSALANEGLLPSPDVFVRTLTAMTRRGETYQRQLLLPLISDFRPSRRFKKKLSYSNEQLARVLGFGEAMTRFSVAGISMSPVPRRVVIRLGALSNLIVSLYDQLVDTHTEREILPRSMLASVLRQEVHSPLISNQASPSAHLVRNAVQTYSKMLHSLPFFGRRVTVRRRINATILRLYDVEEATLDQSRSGRAALEHAVTAKGALSHVVMGLPAWLASHRLNLSAMARHLRWLQALGELHGWIDDVVDIEEDESNHFPNRVMIRLRSTSGRRPEAKLRSVVNEVVSLGCRVRDRWSIASKNETIGRNGMDEFETILCAWLGGPRCRHI
jgi:hypothetical protein